MLLAPRIRWTNQPYQSPDHNKCTERGGGRWGAGRRSDPQEEARRDFDSEAHVRSRKPGQREPCLRVEPELQEPEPQVQAGACAGGPQNIIPGLGETDGDLGTCSCCGPPKPQCVAGGRWASCDVFADPGDAGG